MTERQRLIVGWRTAIAAVAALLALVAPPAPAAEMPPLEKAVRWNDPAEVARLLDAGTAVDVRLADGRTALMVALRLGDPAIIDLLIERGADPNTRDEYGYTPLIYAAYARGASVGMMRHANAANANAKTIEALLARGADLNAQNLEGQSPLSAAAWSGQADIVRLLVARGADVHIRDAEGRTPLIYALSTPSGKNAVAALLDAGVDVNAQDNHQTTALKLATDPTTIRLLIDHGALRSPVDATFAAPTAPPGSPNGAARQPLRPAAQNR